MDVADSFDDPSGDEEGTGGHSFEEEDRSAADSVGTEFVTLALESGK